jgi:hypothetical protein
MELHFAHREFFASGKKFARENAIEAGNLRRKSQNLDDLAGNRRGVWYTVRMTRNHDRQLRKESSDDGPIERTSNVPGI